MKSSLLQSPLGKTPPCGEGGINKVPFLSYKGFFSDKAQRNQVCCSLRVLVLCSGQLVHLCGTVGCGTSGEPKGSIQAAGWAVSGSDFGWAAALWCLHAPSNIQHLLPWLPLCWETYLLAGSFQGASCTHMVGDKGVPWPSTVLTVLG